MRRILSTILILSTLFVMLITCSGCGGKVTPDYESPLEMYSAFNKGENIVGKKVEVTANWDYRNGKIYDGVTPDFSCLIKIYGENDKAEKVKNGDTVVIMITKAESELAGLNVYGNVL